MKRLDSASSKRIRHEGIALPLARFGHERLPTGQQRPTAFRSLAAGLGLATPRGSGLIDTLLRRFDHAPFHLFPKGFSADAEQFCCFADAAVRGGQRAPNMRCLSACEDFVKWGKVAIAVVAASKLGRVIQHIKYSRLAQCDGLLQMGPELSRISRPSLSHEAAHKSL